MSSFGFAFVTLALTVAGQVVMRWRALEHGGDGGRGRWRYLMEMYTDPWVLSAFAAAIVASITYALALQRLPLSVAYPIMALGFVIVPLLGRWLFGDPLSPSQWAGMALIIGGVVLVSRA